MDETIQIPGYNVERIIGNGAMATVYLAVQQALDRRVALKLMASSLLSDQTFRDRFLKEGRIIAQLSHPSIVTIYDIGLAQSNYYMAMEYLAGGTLREHFRESPTPDQAVYILSRIAAALGYAHKRNFVHRDVKPGNILFREDGTPVLTDFGIAKALGDATQMTQAGWTVGTPSYMSPEQALGKAVDARCDLYSLGVVFYEMLSGRKPYQAEDSFALALMHINEPIPRLPEQLSRYQGIIDRLMAKSPDDRFPTAEALGEALRELEPDLTATATTRPRAASSSVDAAPTVAIPSGKRAARPEHKTLWPWWLGGSLSALVLAGYLVYAGVVPLPLVRNYVAGPDIFGIETHAKKPLTKAEQDQIEQLLEIAQLNLETGRLVDPPISNAAYGFHRVLEIDPDNAKARAGLKQIADTYLKKAEDAEAKGEAAATISKYVKAGLVAAPNYPKLLKLKHRLDQRLSQN